MNIEFCNIKYNEDKTVIITSEKDKEPIHIAKYCYSRTVIYDVDDNCNINQLFKDYIIETLADNKIKIKYIPFNGILSLLKDYLPKEIKDEFNK